MSRRSQVFHGPPGEEPPEDGRTRRRNRRRRGEKERYCVTVRLKNSSRPIVVYDVTASDCEALREAFKNRAKLKKRDRTVSLTDQLQDREVLVDVGRIVSFDIE